MRHIVPAAILALWAAAVPAAASAQFYVRADVGTSRMQGTSFQDRDCNSADNLLGCGVSVTSDSQQSQIFDLGVGFAFGPIFRADVTLGRRNATFEGTDNKTPSGSGRAGQALTSSLVNLYVDVQAAAGLGDFPFRPYVTGGAGFVRIDTEEFNSTRNVGRGVVNVVNIITPGGSTTNAAFQVGGGVEFGLLPNLSLDLGYRFMDFGRAVGDSGVSRLGNSRSAVDGVRSGRVHVHDVTLGLRFSF